MDIFEAIESRQSVRAYTSEPVDPAALERMVHAAAHAPSSWNTQPWRFHITRGVARERFGEAMALTTRYLGEAMDIMPAEQVAWAEAFYASLGNAPVAIALSVPSPEDPTDRVNTFVAAGCALQNFLLAATAEGYGCCSLTAPEWVRESLSEALEIGEDREIACVIILGHPAEHPEAKPRLTDIAYYYD